MDLIAAVAARYFPAPGEAEHYCNRPSEWERIVSAQDTLLTPELIAKLDQAGRAPGRAGDVKYVFLTKSGPGPVPQDPSEALLDAATGLPREPGPKHKRMKLHA